MRTFSFILAPSFALAMLSALAGCVTQPPARPQSLTGRTEPPRPAVNISDARAPKASGSIETVSAPPAQPIELTRVLPKPAEIVFQAAGSSVAGAGAAPPVVILKLESPILLRQESPQGIAEEPGVSALRQEPLPPSETSPRFAAVIEKIVNTIVHMDGITLFGLVAVVAMLIFYTFEERSPLCILGFALACWMGSTYGFLQGAWPFGMVEGIWGFVALRDWWQKFRPPEAIEATEVRSASPIQA